MKYAAQYSQLVMPDHIKTLESKNCHGEIINIGYGRPVKVKKLFY